MDQVNYRQARRDDLPAVARIFLNAFDESVRHYAGKGIPPAVIEDVFNICLDAEPEAFIVAEVDGVVAGYIFAPSKFSKLTPTALRNGYLGRMFRNWIAGSYGIGIKPLLIAARNWLHLLMDARQKDLETDARILSVAVDPSYQDHGVGTGLVQRGLEYLESQGVENIRLEVRPTNPAAKHLYEKYGFQPKGTTKDTQGDWLIMLKNLSGGAPA